MVPKCGSDAVAGSNRFRQRIAKNGLRSGLFFNARPNLLLPVANLLFVAFPRTSRGPLRTPAQLHQNLPHMTLMIGHPKFLFDQVGHAGAGPQRRFVTQTLRSLQQQFLQLPQLLLVQTRLAASAPSFLQPFLTTRTIVLDPTVYGLADGLEAAGNGGWRLAAFVQANEFEAAIFQGIKIAAYSTRISHASLDATEPKMFLYIMRDSIDVNNRPPILLRLVYQLYEPISAAWRLAKILDPVCEPAAPGVPTRVVGESRMFVVVNDKGVELGVLGVDPTGHAAITLKDSSGKLRWYLK